MEHMSSMMIIIIMLTFPYSFTIVFFLDAERDRGGGGTWTGDQDLYCLLEFHCKLPHQEHNVRP